jgi:hypothetical protein
MEKIFFGICMARNEKRCGNLLVRVGGAVVPRRVSAGTARLSARNTAYRCRVRRSPFNWFDGWGLLSFGKCVRRAAAGAKKGGGDPPADDADDLPVDGEVMHAFLGRPTRGGMLTIVNCLLWAVVVLGLAARVPVLSLPALVACWPVAWLFILPTLGNRDGDTLVVACVMIGVNAPLWGYGLSWALSLTVDRWRPREAETAQRGFEVVIAPTPSEPLAPDSTPRPR